MANPYLKTSADGHTTYHGLSANQAKVVCNNNPTTPIYEVYRPAKRSLYAEKVFSSLVRDIAEQHCRDNGWEVVRG